MAIYYFSWYSHKGIVRREIRGIYIVTNRAVCTSHNTRNHRCFWVNLKGKKTVSAFRDKRGVCSEGAHATKNLVPKLSVMYLYNTPPAASASVPIGGVLKTSFYTIIFSLHAPPVGTCLFLYATCGTDVEAEVAGGVRRSIGTWTVPRGRACLQ